MYKCLPSNQQISELIYEFEESENKRKQELIKFLKKQKKRTFCENLIEGFVWIC